MITEKLEKIRTTYGSPMKVFSSLVRAMIIPSPGCELFIGDFSSVELRILFWIAEHEEGLQSIREGVDLYKGMAAYIFNLLVEEIAKDSIERFIGKETILGAGFGMGWSKFLKTCHAKNLKYVDAKMAKKAIYAYRELHHPVPALWASIERAVVEAIRHPGTAYSLNKVSVYVLGDFLNIKLPSGRKLKYFKPRLSQKTLSAGRSVPQIHHWAMNNLTHQWEETVSWGGVFVNNIVQGTARDLMANALMNIEESKYKCLLLVHDEAVSERKKGCGDIKEYLGLMADRLPTWADGLPISAEGFIADRYFK